MVKLYASFFAISVETLVKTLIAGLFALASFSGLLPTSATGATTVTTLAGSLKAGFKDGAGSQALFNQPFAIALDPSGDLLVVDEGNSAIRKVTAAGVVTTVARTPSQAVLGIAVDSKHHVYWTEQTSSTQFGVSELKGPGTIVHFAQDYVPNGQPSGIVVDQSFNVYISDLGTNDIYKIDSQRVVSLFAGSGKPGNANGTGTEASFNQPFSVTVDGSGNLYVLDISANLGTGEIRKITPAQVVTTITSELGSFSGGIAADSNGTVYATQSNNIDQITPSGVDTRVAGSGQAGSKNGSGLVASFDSPNDVAVDSTGSTIYVADTGNNEIRKIVITK